jgi:hypothetical protein
MGFSKQQVQKWQHDACAARGVPVPEDVAAVVEKKPSKYRNKRVVVDGERFDSKKEANRWGYLKLMVKVGTITKLERQVRFPLVVGGESVGDYIADFVYERDGQRVVEDVKSRKTKTLSTYRLKKKLMKTIHGVDIREA